MGDFYAPKTVKIVQRKKGLDNIGPILITFAK